MAKPSGQWKVFERLVAAALGGKRRGPGTGDGSAGSGRNDVIHDALSIECKLRGALPWSTLVAAVKQAEGAAEVTALGPQLPVAVVKLKRAPNADTLVVLRLETFAKRVAPLLESPPDRDPSR